MVNVIPPKKVVELLRSVGVRGSTEEAERELSAIANAIAQDSHLIARFRALYAEILNEEARCRHELDASQYPLFPGN